MSDEEHFDDAHMDAVSATPTDFFDHDPSRAEKIEVRTELDNAIYIIACGIKEMVESHHGCCCSCHGHFPVSRRIGCQLQRTIPFSWGALCWIAELCFCERGLGRRRVNVAQIHSTSRGDTHET